MPSFIFGGNTGLTHKDLIRLRNQSLSSMGSGTPSLGSGIRDAGSAIASMIYNSKAKEVGEKEEADKQKTQSEFNAVLGDYFKPQQPSMMQPQYEQPDFTQSQTMAEEQITSQPLEDIRQKQSKQYSFDDNVLNAIKTASSKHGVDADTMAMIAQIESGGNPNAKNPNSSASGLMQFTKGTASQYGLQNPMDVNQNADAGARLTLDNQRALQKSLGRMPTKEELYLAHQQGIGGATALLANPEQKALDSLSQVYKNPETARQAIINNGGSLDMTAGDFSNKWLDKARKYNNYSLNPSQQPQQSEPVYFPSELPQGQMQEQPQEVMQQPSMMQSQAMSNPDFSKILPFLSNPNISDGQRLIASKMLEKQMSKLYPDALTEAKLKGYSQTMTINEQNQALQQKKYEQEMQLANAKSEQEAVKFQNNIRQTEANINKLNAQAKFQDAQAQNANNGRWGQLQVMTDPNTGQQVSVMINSLTGEKKIVDGLVPKKEFTPFEKEQQRQTAERYTADKTFVDNYDNSEEARLDFQNDITTASNKIPQGVVENARNFIKRQWSGSTEGDDARSELQNKILNMTLSDLKNTFGANVTDSEREAYLKSVADPDASPAQIQKSTENFILLQKQKADLARKRLQGYNLGQGGQQFMGATPQGGSVRTWNPETGRLE